MGNGLHVAGWHPFHCETGPGHGVRVNSVVKEGSIFLPDFVLLENALFFDLINVVN